eukprot:7002573-Pyramimonas_sp.AAC.1
MCIRDRDDAGKNVEDILANTPVRGAAPNSRETMFNPNQQRREGPERGDGHGDPCVRHRWGGAWP